MGIDGLFAHIADAELEARIAALERENAALKSAFRMMLGGVRPGMGTPNPFRLASWESAQAAWDEIFGESPQGGGGGEGEGN